MSEKAFKSQYPKGTIPRQSKAHGTTFVCRRGLNLKTSLYTEPMIWEDVSHGTAEEVHQLIDFLEKPTKVVRKRKFDNIVKKDDNFTGGFVEEEDSDAEAGINITPRKKRKNTTLGTPRKIKTPSKLLTPRHKR